MQEKTIQRFIESSIKLANESDDMWFVQRLADLISDHLPDETDAISELRERETFLFNEDN